MKKEWFSIRPSDIPRDIWIKIVLTNPLESYPIITKKYGAFVGFKAYFPDHGDKRVFNIVFKVNQLKFALMKLNEEERQIVPKPTYFEFKYKKRRLMIRNYKVL